MAKKRLLAEIKISPPRFYRVPGDVLRDRRFGDDERLEILKAWVTQAEPERTEELTALIAEIERRSEPNDHAAE